MTRTTTVFALRMKSWAARTLRPVTTTGHPPLTRTTHSACIPRDVKHVPKRPMAREPSSAMMPTTTGFAMTMKSQDAQIQTPATTTPHPPLTPTILSAYSRRVVKAVLVTWMAPDSSWKTTTMVMASATPLKSQGAPTPKPATTTPRPPPTPITPSAYSRSTPATPALEKPMAAEP